MIEGNYRNKPVKHSNRLNVMFRQTTCMKKGYRKFIMKNFNEKDQLLLEDFKY